jgi:hypothetical protein
MNKWTLYSGRLIIWLDLGWLIYAFILFVILEVNNDADAVFLKYILGFFHMVTMVTMLYLTEKKYEEDPNNYELLNLDWKNAPLLIAPLFTDVVILVRSIRSLSGYPFYSALVGWKAYALAVTCASLVWFIYAVYQNKKRNSSLSKDTSVPLLPSSHHRLKHTK